MKAIIQCVLFIVILSSVSCSIERRHHMAGFHVEWKTRAGNQRSAPSASRHHTSLPNVEKEAVADTATLEIEAPVLFHKWVSCLTMRPGKLASVAEHPYAKESYLGNKTLSKHSTKKNGPVEPTLKADDDDPVNKKKFQLWLALSIGAFALAVLVMISFIFSNAPILTVLLMGSLALGFGFGTIALTYLLKGAKIWTYLSLLSLLLCIVMISPLFNVVIMGFILFALLTAALAIIALKKLDATDWFNRYLSLVLSILGIALALLGTYAAFAVERFQIW